MIDNFSHRRLRRAFALFITASIAVFHCAVAQAAGTVMVTNVNDSGTGSLRNAITYASANPDTTIKFNIPSANLAPIFVDSALPQLSGTGTILDGTSQPGYSGTPLIVLSGSKVTETKIVGLVIWGSNCVIKGLAVQSFSDCGIAIDGKDAANNTVQGCIIGSGGLANRTPNLGQGVAIRFGAHDNLIGGSQPAMRNIISDNKYQNVLLVVAYEDPTSGAKSYVTGNKVQGNYIGTDVTGKVAIPNGDGVQISTGAHNNVIGGTNAGEGNLISGNANRGVDITNEDNIGNVVEGNLIGLDVTGTKALPNYYGISFGFGSYGNTVGGTAAGARNIISGNTVAGVAIGAPYTGKPSYETIQGNYIGTNKAGTAAVANGGNGIQIYGIANAKVLGNLVSGNGMCGIQLGYTTFDQGGVTNGTIVQGNLVGTDVTGTKALPNGADGVEILNGAYNNTIGGTGAGQANIIAFNGSYGVGVYTDGTFSNRIRANSIYDNDGIGINLQNSNDPASGITPNDARDVDKGGPNNYQNFPVIQSVDSSGGSIMISGSLNSTGYGTFALDFYRSSTAGAVGGGEGQAETLLGTKQVTTGESGDGVFSIVLPFAGSGTYFTVTATNTATGDTSELSRPFVATLPQPQPAISGRCLSIRADSTYSATERVGIAGALVSLIDSSGVTVAQISCGSDGSFTILNVNPGKYTLTAKAPRAGLPDVTLDPPTRAVTVGSTDVMVPRFALYSVFGIVKKPDGSGANVPLSGATVSLYDAKNVLIATRTTGADGKYEFRNQPAAKYSVKATASGYSFPKKSMTLMTSGETWSPCARAHIVGVPAAVGPGGSATSF